MEDLNSRPGNDLRKEEKELKKTLKSYSLILKNPLIILCCSAMFFYIGIFSVLSTWLTTYFNGLGVELSYSSLILAAFWVFNALGVILAGKILLKTNEASLLLLLSIFGAVSSIIYGVLPLTYIKIGSLVLQAIFYSSFFPLLNAIAVKEDPDFSGSILGMTISVAVLGQIIFQPLNGFIMQYFGPDGINYLLMICATALFISTFFLFRFSARKHGISFKLPLLK